MPLLNDFQILRSGSGGGGAAYRREDQINTGMLAHQQSQRFQLAMGKAVTIVGLKTTSPCIVRIFGKKDFSDPNPFQFVAYPGFLSYEGAVWDTLGTVWGNNNHPTLVNKDQYTSEMLYIEVANPFDEPVQVTVSLTWLVLEG